jgi:hypothetical protein
MVTVLTQETLEANGAQVVLTESLDFLSLMYFTAGVVNLTNLILM